MKQAKLWLIGLLLILAIGQASAFRLGYMQNYSFQTNQSVDVSLQFIEDNASFPVQNLTFFVLADPSIAIEGRLWSYHDNMTLENGTWKQIKLHMAGYAPGTHLLQWGVNLSNGTVISDTFAFILSGNASDPGLYNESDYLNLSMTHRAARRYGYSGTDIVAERLMNKSRHSLANASIVEETVTYIPTPEYTPTPSFQDSIENQTGNASAVPPPAPAWQMPLWLIITCFAVICLMASAAAIPLVKWWLKL